MEDKMSQPFSYEEFTKRNLGFVTDAEQQKLRDGSVFICGVGGMGGACMQSLARAGVGHLVIADFDEFEISNLNRQVFADMDTVGQSKVDSTAAAVRKINPEIELTIYGQEWPDSIDTIMSGTKIVVNGMDDVRAGLHLYRKARDHNVTVIDAYTSPLPSATCVRPADPRPEERLNFPINGADWNTLSDDDVFACVMKEMEYVLINSSTVNHIHLDYAVEMLNGTRSRMSFAPMVITAGTLMSYEAIKLLLGDTSTTDYRGYFFNPFSQRTEKPRPPIVRHVLAFIVRRYIRKLMNVA
jgi:molybdopterin/thiamine biosynthesis adenylyltransferase